MHFLNGRIALEAGNPDLANSEFRSLLEDPKLGGQAREYLAKAFLMTGNGKQALATLGDSKPTTALGYAIASGANSLTGQSEAADRLLAQGLAAFPDSADLLVLDGTRALSWGDADKAAALAARAVKSEPDNVQALLFAGRVALAGQKFDAAGAYFDQVLQRRPKHQTALIGKATIAYDRGDKAAAASILKDAAAQLGGSSPAIAYFQAQLAFDADDAEKANAILQGMGDVSNFQPALMLSGLVAAKRGQNEQAISALRRFLGNGGEDGRARFALARSLMAVGQKPDAWAVLRPLADAANANTAVLGLAAGLTGELKLPAADAYKTRLAAMAKGDPLRAPMTEADKAISAGDWAKADGIYSGLLRDNPASANVILLNNAANAKLQLGQAAEAEQLARRAVAAAPNDPIVLDTLAWVLFKSRGATPEVDSLIRRAVGAMPGNATIRQHALLITRPKANS